VGPTPVRRSRKALWAGIALVALLLVTGITLGTLYYLGWLDSEPEAPPPKPHKPAPAKPHPTPAPTHKPPLQLR
jgi:hypothetical protein